MKKIEAAWSKGIALWCDCHGPESYPEADTEAVQPPRFFLENFSRASRIIWVRLSTSPRVKAPCDLDHFVDAALPHIDRPFVLVTTDGDASVPADIHPSVVAALLSSPKLVAWRTQNYSGCRDSRLAPFPIGLDLHTPRPEGDAEALFGLIAGLRRCRTDIFAQPLEILSDIGLSLASYDRMEAVRLLDGHPLIKSVRSRVSQTEIWKLYASCPFVLSAPGFGMDCHRTYEALYLGSIVIMKHSSLDALFKGLPVVFVDDWAEVMNVSSLREWRELYGPLTSWENIFHRLHPATLLSDARNSLSAAEQPG
jgi:hypothetical protein